VKCYKFGGGSGAITPAIPSRILLSGVCFGAMCLFSGRFLVAQTNATAVVQKSVEVNDRDWAAAPEFDYCETEKDGDGGKTYMVSMIYGSPYRRLVATNGHRLSASQEKAEKRKLKRTIAKRRSESAAERSRRIAKYKADRKRDHSLMNQLTEAFDFKASDEQNLSGHNVYALAATARPGYKPPSRETRALTGMEGKLWIDKDTSQWVKVEAHVIHPVSIESFVAKVEPGTRFELEKTPVTQDIWLRSHFSMKAKAKVFFFLSHKEQEDDTFFHYQKADGVSDYGASESCEVR
jgi:hypothetical protein